MEERKRYWMMKEILQIVPVGGTVNNDHNVHTVPINSVSFIYR